MGIITKRKEDDGVVGQRSLTRLKAVMTAPDFCA
jgi:hypothetical protein